MDPKGVLESWLAPITDPLKEFRSQIQEISTIHQNSVKTFQSQVNDLTDSSSADAMTGAGADSMTLAAENYTSTELTVSELEGSISSIANASGLCEQVVADLLEAMGDAGFAAADVGTLAEVTAEVDASAVLQGGFDPFDDVIAGALTSVTVETVVAGLIIFVTIIAGIIWVWRTTMDGLAGSFQHSALPEKPQPIKPNVKPAPPIKIYLNDEQEKALQDIIDALAKVGIKGIPRDLLERLLFAGFDKSSILAAILSWRSAGWSIGRINSMLDDAAYNVINTIPYGMQTPEELRAFITTLTTSLKQSGYPCTSVSLGGSAVTGKKYTTGAPFDVGRTSDYDVAIADPILLAKAKQLGVELRSDGTRTGPIKAKQQMLLNKLGLLELSKKLSKQAGGRAVNFMIYDSIVAAASRAPSIIFLTNSCP